MTGTDLFFTRNKCKRRNIELYFRIEHMCRLRQKMFCRIKLIYKRRISPFVIHEFHIKLTMFKLIIYSFLFQNSTGSKVRFVFSYILHKNKLNFVLSLARYKDLYFYKVFAVQTMSVNEDYIYKLVLIRSGK